MPKETLVEDVTIYTDSNYTVIKLKSSASK
jgi:hypothetical protein